MYCLVFANNREWRLNCISLFLFVLYKKQTCSKSVKKQSESKGFVEKKIEKNVPNMNYFFGTTSVLKSSEDFHIVN